MHIVIDTESTKLMAIGTLTEYWSNGYPVITDMNGLDCAYPTDFTTLYKVDYIPDGVEAEKYCYTPEYGFYENLYYVPIEENDEQKMI